MQTTVKAGGDILVMVIVGLFWVIAQIAGAAAKKKAASSRPDFDEDADTSADEVSALSNVDGFADLMRKLSGGQEFKIPHPPGPPHNELRSDTRESAQSPEPLWDTEERDGLLHPTRDGVNPEPMIQPVEVSAMPDPVPAMSAFSQAMPSIKMPTLDLNFQTLEKTGGNVPTFGKLIDLGDKQSVRRAILSHIIFSEPKAMEGWNARHAG